MKNVAVIGSGTMGNGIAHLLALYGHSVTLIDLDEGALLRGMTTINKNLARQVDKGVIELGPKDIEPK